MALTQEGGASPFFFPLTTRRISNWEEREEKRNLGGRERRKEGKTFPSKKTSEGEEKRPASLESKQSRGGPRINVAADRQNGGKKEKGKLLVDVTDKKYPQTTFARLRVQKQSGIAPKKKFFRSIP